MSPLWDIPGMSLDRIKVDWLHCADLGVAPEFEGNLLWHLVSKKKVPGRIQDDRISFLLKHMQSYYQENSVENQLPTLTKEMIWKSKGSGPKLRSKAAEARYLIPWCKKACDEFLVGADSVDVAVKAACEHLHECYSCLGGDRFEQPRMADACRKFSLQMLSLNEATADGLWNWKPKHHMFQELAEYANACPTLTWTYRDEDFGGSLAALARSAGGSNSPLGVSSRVLGHFMARHCVPSF